MKQFIFNEKEAGVIQLALEVLIGTLDNKNDNYAAMVNALAKRLREYTEEEFASVHSQGG